MDSSFYAQLLIVFVIIAAAGAMFYYFYFRGENKKSAENAAYLQALKFMAEKDHRRAIEKFKEAVRLDTTNIDAYIKLGDILREEGLFANAVRVHKDLTLRGNVAKEEQYQIWFSLGLDYWKMQKYESAEKWFAKLQSVPEYMMKIIPYLVKVYDKQEKYDKAFDLLKNSALHREEKYKHRMALYKVLMGLQLREKGQEKDARILFKEAIKLDPAFVAPYLYMGDSYLQEEDRKDDAIKIWTEYCKKYPVKAYLLFPRLEKAWYEKGFFNKIEELYESILKADPNNQYALLALSKILRKKGQYDAALSLLHENSKPEMDDMLLKAEEAHILLEKGEAQQAAELSVDLLDSRLLSQQPLFSCPICGHRQEEPFWKCPECKAVNTEL